MTKKNKSATIENDIRERLAAGEWKPGQRLPDERSLSLQYGVARNTVRKAIGHLETEKLVDRQVGRGTVALEKPDERSTKILKSFTEASPADILDLRLFIEPATAAVAARNLSETDLAGIREAANEAENAQELETYEFWDNEFHRRINFAARNQFLSDFFSLLTIIRYTEPMMEIRKQRFSEERRQHYNEEHQEIIEALKNWDSERASRAMRNHLASRRRNYFGR